ncbi:MAG TPA: TetR/AcrR family transcriptional regulator [Solirubrobacteraceae bacterium]|jgi:AcrR family transcriptional regulator
MAVRGARPKPTKRGAPSRDSQQQPEERYRRLPTGAHGLDPKEVQRDQRERLRDALIELIASHGYQAVRILDLTKLARVSRPTFYSLYADKEELFLAAYDDIAARTAQTVLEAYDIDGSQGERMCAAMRAFGELAATKPDSVSLLVLGAFGAGAKALERRNRTLQALEQSIRTSRDRASASATRARGRRAPKANDDNDLTVKIVLGGIREVTAARLREGRAGELPGLADQLTAWAASYPVKLPAGLDSSSPASRRRGKGEPPELASERALRAEGRLPSGRHDLPRQFIVKSQRERIVDATAAIVAEKGLAGLTIPEIARRASVSHQTFYEMYPTKHDAFLGAQKVGLHQALLVTVEAYEAHKDNWPHAVAAGLRALIDYLSGEPAHAHLTLVDTFGASPEAIEIRDAALHGFATYLNPGYELAPAGVHVPKITAEAIAGGIWQVLHHYIEDDRISELPDATPQIVYMALTPFLGPKEAAKAGRWIAARR